MTDDGVKVEGIRKAAYDGLLILALILLGDSRRNARASVTVGDVSHLIYIGHWCIYGSRILGLSIGRSCRYAHVYSINHLSGSLVNNAYDSLVSCLYLAVKLNDEMGVNIDILCLVQRITTDGSLRLQFHSHGKNSQ